ncbi:hypothetical protein, partial [Ferruginibacter sp. HRS2-29]|uniref:hypothetical protein n=1 Tax=Ferruginibacter sp. HRS2-29 TaxID=2487334 RepID=UPI0020CF51AD
APQCHHLVPRPAAKRRCREDGKKSQITGSKNSNKPYKSFFFPSSRQTVFAAKNKYRPQGMAYFACGCYFYIITKLRQQPLP